VSAKGAELAVTRSERTVPTVKVSRLIRGTPEQIFELWTDPALMARWMTPYAGDVDCVAEADLQVGGTFKLAMKSGDTQCDIHGAYVSIDAPRLLIFTWQGPPTQNEPTLVTVELTTASGGTQLTLTHEKLPTEQLRQAHGIGWGNMLDHLENIAA
jgi:uncharacterized protein YndB with AHSA1/START domain